MKAAASRKSSASSRPTTTAPEGARACRGTGAALLHAPPGTGSTRRIRSSAASNPRPGGSESGSEQRVPTPIAFMAMTKLSRMKMLATGLLVAAGVVYVAASALEPGRPWMHYVAKAAEAAMIGTIADWFAVVALFHHPLNLRFIPHTAILPRNKARIAQGLSQFIQTNFLSSAAVVARIAEFRPAQTLCRWLLRRENAEALAGYATRLVAYALGAVDDERLRAFLSRTVAAQLRKADVASAAAQVLEVLTQHGRHHALLDEALAGLDELLTREDVRQLIAEEVKKSAPPMLRAINRLFDLKLDERAALKIVDVALRKISEVRRDRGHELRERFD